MGFRFLCPALVVLETKLKDFSITVTRLKENGEHDGEPDKSFIDLSSELLKCHPKHIDGELQKEEIIEELIKLGEQLQRELKEEERKKLEQKAQRIATDLDKLKAETEVTTVSDIKMLLEKVPEKTQKDKLSELGKDLKQNGEKLKKSGRRLQAKLKELGGVFKKACGKLPAHSPGKSNDRDAIELGQAVLLTAYPIFRAAEKFPATAQHLLIIPISDPLRSDASLGICVVLFDEKPNHIGELEAEHLKPLLSDAHSFGQLLRAIDLEGLAARPEAAPVVAGKVDLATIVRAVANQGEANPGDDREFQRPCKAYNYALEAIVHTMFEDFKDDKDELQFKKLTSSLNTIEGERPQNLQDCIRWAKRVSDTSENSTKWGAADEAPEWLTKLTGASPAYIAFLERVVRDAMTGGNKTKPRIIFLYSEPGCGKEMLAQVLHFARVRHFLCTERDTKLNCLVAGNPPVDWEQIKLRPKNAGIRLERLIPKNLTSWRNTVLLPHFISFSYHIVNCGTLSDKPETFSEKLFGSLDNLGPYTKAGALHGTIFLDEFNTLRDPRVADHLLRVFDPGIVPVGVGGTATGTTDIRLAPLVVIASNYTRQELLDTGFNPAVVNRVTQNYYGVPPLRQRKEDILLIIDSLLLGEKKDCLRKNKN